MDRWDTYADAWWNLFEARRELLADENLVELVKKGLANPSHRKAALVLLREAKSEVREALMPQLLGLAVYPHGLAREAEEVLFTIDHGWLAANIEKAAEEILAENDYTEQANLLNLYERLDEGLSKKLRASLRNHSDPDIRELAED
ncbi:MAG: hypothetical protein L6R28_15885 [Planctomycetes bacterium]|nr:hypothetical protein [Planctomycetota bacterium]